MSKCNINDVNILNVQNDIYNMLNLLDSHSVIPEENILKKRFDYLFKISPTLFNFILKNHNKQDRKTLLSNIDMMLALVVKVQKSQVSLYDASAIVGQKIGEQYIPQLQTQTDQQNNNSNDIN